MPENVARSFNHTLGYFRSSHDSPLVKKKDEFVKPESAGNIDVGIEQHLFEEIEKFNKLKLQKQVISPFFPLFHKKKREAKFIYDEENKRLKIIEDMKEKEKRLEEYKKQMIKKKVEKKNFFFIFLGIKKRRNEKSCTRKN